MREGRRLDSTLRAFPQQTDELLVHQSAFFGINAIDVTVESICFIYIRLHRRRQCLSERRFALDAAADLCACGQGPLVAFFDRISLCTGALDGG